MPDQRFTPTGLRTRRLSQDPKFIYLFNFVFDAISFCSGVEGPPRKSFERGVKEKSPGVSFAKAGEMLDFSERQYQTVHAGRNPVLLFYHFSFHINYQIDEAGSLSKSRF